MKILFFLIFFPYMLLAIEKSNVDNLTIFNQVAEQLVQQICSRVDYRNYQKIIIESLDSNNNSDWLIEKSFINVLKTGGADSVFLLKSLQTQDDHKPFQHQSTLTISFKTIEFHIDYKNVNSFWKTKSTARQIIIELWIKMQHLENGALIWAGNVRETSTDDIDIKQIPEFENKNIIFTMAPVPSTPGWRRIVEPTLAIGLSGAIIYLFFTFRSK